MLPRQARLTRSADFTEVVRRGRRASRPLLTVHASEARSDPSTSPGAQSRAGLVVSRAVGASVVRSQTSRRLRHVLRELLPQLPPGTRLVVRAAPAAGTASSARLAHDVGAALRRLQLIDRP